VLRADVTLLGDLTLGPRTRVRFHLGTRDIGARVVGRLTVGTLQPVRIALDAPVVARAGDRFVLRSVSPVSTIGGGVVTDPLPLGLRVRAWPNGGLSASQRLSLLVTERGTAGLAVDNLPVRLGVARNSIESTLDNDRQAVIIIGDTV